MKDAKGHGSNGRDAFDASKRAGVAAHQSLVNEIGKVKGWENAIVDQVRRFEKSESGYGLPLGGNVSPDPEDTHQLIGEAYHVVTGAAQHHMSLADGTAMLLHLAKFLGVLAIIALANLLVHGAAYAMGWHLS